MLKTRLREFKLKLPSEITEDFPDLEATAHYDTNYLGWVIDYGKYKIVLEDLEELNEPKVISVIKGNLQNAR